MSEDVKLCDEVAATAKQAAKLLTGTYKQIRSVSVIIDWMPGTDEGMPTGLWQINDNVEPLLASMNMGVRMGRALIAQQNTSIRIIDDIDKSFKDAQHQKEQANEQSASQPAGDIVPGPEQV